MVLGALIINGAATVADSAQKLWALGASFLSPGHSLSEKELASKGVDIARRILAYAEDRLRAERQPDSENWAEGTRQLIQANAETRIRYMRDFAPDVLLVREEFRKRGLSDESLDRLAQDPTNLLGVQQVATSILALVATLKQ